MDSASTSSKLNRIDKQIDIKINNRQIVDEYVQIFGMLEIGNLRSRDPYGQKKSKDRIMSELFY